MKPNELRKNYFVSKELRLSIAVMLLWALLITGFFTYIATELGDKFGSSYLLFVVIMAGYLAIVVLLSIFFSHRILGPFQRLKIELRIIMSGNYGMRLKVRQNDDLSMKSFVYEVNNLLDEYEGLHIKNKELTKLIDSEIMALLSVFKENGKSPAELQDEILECHKKLKAYSEK